MSLIEREPLLKQLDDRPADGWMSIQSIRAIISGAPEVKPARPEAVWKCVGHKSGLFSHPLSINFQCPLCDYEHYQIGGLGLPDTCPNCGALMHGTTDFKTYKELNEAIALELKNE